MRFAVPHFTTLLLLLHTALGCCMHHAHTCEVDGWPQPATSAESSDGGMHEHARDMVTSPIPETDPAKHPAKHHCAEARCSYVQSERSPDRMDEFVAHVRSLDAVVTTGDIDNRRMHLERRHDQPIRHVGIPLRSHLALRVLLL